MNRIKIGRTSKWFGRPIYQMKVQIPLGDGTFIPVGFVTDLLSAPAAVKWCLPNDHLELPAIKHDFRRRCRPDISIEMTDILFLMDMYEANVPTLTRLICYASVTFNKNRS